jgi:hypothetical protein
VHWAIRRHLPELVSSLLGFGAGRCRATPPRVVYRCARFVTAGELPLDYPASEGYAEGGEACEDALDRDTLVPVDNLILARNREFTARMVNRYNLPLGIEHRRS